MTPLTIEQNDRAFMEWYHGSVGRLYISNVTHLVKMTTPGPELANCLKMLAKAGWLAGQLAQAAETHRQLEIAHDVMEAHR